MMNLLNIASQAISVLNPNQYVILTLVDTYRVNGIAQKTYTDFKAIAQVQNIENEVLQKDTYLQGVTVKKFFISMRSPDIINFFKSATNTNSQIKYQDKIWTIYKIDDWELNGWKKLIAILNH